MLGIINLKNYTDALRNTGYRNAECAIAEIVDNSLEAEARDVLIICTEGASTGRRKVEEIAILDNGTGMDDEVLKKCLVIGESTRRQKKGMGRFGVGLPQASLHVCPRVDVFSWNEKNHVQSVYLDINEIKNGSQDTVIVNKNSEIPKKYHRYLQDFKINNVVMNFASSGTLVVWSNCDKLEPKTVPALFKRFEYLLGRKFRYFINEGKNYIGLTVHKTREHDHLLRPNDPLCLMRDNVMLGNPKDPTKAVRAGEGEPIFEFWENGDTCGEVIKDITFESDGLKRHGNVCIRFSWAKKKYHDAGGSSEIGKFIKNNVGISIVRANREIDFGKFDFFSDVNEPQHRWWGCEIKFEPDLDEAFKVANNKQQVELYRLEPTEYIEDEVKPLWFELNDIVQKEIKNIYNDLKKRQKGKRNKTNSGNLPEEAHVDRIEKGNHIHSASSENKKNSSMEKLVIGARKHFNDQGNPDPSDEEVMNALSLAIKLEYKDLGDNSTFIDVSSKMGNVWLTINTGSIFYRDLYSKIRAKNDEPVMRAFNLVLMAFAKAEDEAFLNKGLYSSFQDVREHWGIKLKKYLSNKDYQA